MVTNIFGMQISFLDYPFNVSAFSQSIQKNVRPFYYGDFFTVNFHPMVASFLTPGGVFEGQLSLCPKNVGCVLPFDDDKKPHEIDDDEMLDLTLHMYDFLKDNSDFDLAWVGWEPGVLSNYLHFDRWRNLVRVDEIEGLVVSNRLLDKTPASAQWHEFSETHSWIPCNSAFGTLGEDGLKVGGCAF